MKELIYDDDTHTYTLVEDGRRRELPSVTRILEAEGFTNPSPYWRPEHAERGRIVHKICALHDRGGVDEATIEGAYRGYFESYKKGCAALKIERENFVAIERPMANEEYAGTPDRIYLTDDTVLVPELKTGQSYPAHAIQLAAYFDLAVANEIFDYSIQWKKLMGMYLKADGRIPNIVEYPLTGLHIWRMAVKIYMWKEQNGCHR